jgi:hypothetical protein
LEEDIMSDYGIAEIRARTELSAEAKAARKPLPPEELFDAKQDRVHRETGRARAARTVRNKRRGMATILTRYSLGD